METLNSTISKVFLSTRYLAYVLRHFLTESSAFSRSSAEGGNVMSHSDFQPGQSQYDPSRVRERLL